MKKTTLFLCLANSMVSAYAANNIISLDKLMFHSIVADTAQEQLTQRYPAYARYLDNTDVLLLLNYINTTDKAVIIKFSAQWCGPCKRLVPIVHDAAQTYNNQVAVIEINIDDYPTLRTMFDINAVPTLIYFKDGIEIDRTHSVSKQALLDKIEELITQKSENPPTQMPNRHVQNPQTTSTKSDPSNLKTLQELMRAGTAPQDIKAYLKEHAPALEQFAAHKKPDAALFSYIAQQTKPVMVKFYGSWCKPCQKMKPIVHEVAQLFTDSIKVIMVEMQPHTRHMLQAFDARGIPTFVFFKNGKKIGQHTGMLSKQNLINKIEKTLT